MNIKDFIGEATEYDKKEKLEERKPRSWLKSVSAFANGIGGALIFGIADDETLVGVEDVRYVSEKISEIMKNKMDPIPSVILENHSENGKDFIILRVLPGQETPYYYVADGNRVAYIRVGNESIPADALALKRLVLHGANMTYDSVVSSYLFEKFSFTRLRSVYRKRTGRDLQDSDFISFELMDENGKLTNAGALLADDSPVRWSRLFCTRWYGLDKASGVMEALDDKEFSGSLVALLLDGMDFVKNNTKKRWKKTTAGRVEMPEYPEQAVREALVNALIHRDYMEMGSEVHIDIFDDRMEIYSPGGMFDGTIVQNLDLDNVASKRRNPVIADIFSRMHYMERRGSGFKKIRTEYEREVNYTDDVKPNFRSTPTSFFVTLYNLNYNVPIEKKVDAGEKPSIEDKEPSIEDKEPSIEQKIGLVQHSIDAMKVTERTKENVKLLFKRMDFTKYFGRKDIMECVGITIAPAGDLLRKMKNAGLIETVTGCGKGKYRFIEPTEKISEELSKE